MKKRYYLLLLTLSFLITGCTLIFEEKPKDDLKEAKLITANPIDLSPVIRISKFRSCAGHDYSGFNTHGEKETLRSMKHYIEASQPLIGDKNTVKVFAPFDGTVAEIHEGQGKQIFISADKNRAWHFIFFHITLEPGIQTGTKVRAGQHLGQGYLHESPNFDIALKRFGILRQLFDSPFRHMDESVLDEYTARGITPESIILSKEFRDAYPCPLQGTSSHGDAYFTGETDAEDFVSLK